MATKGPSLESSDGLRLDKSHSSKSHKKSKPVKLVVWTMEQGNPGIETSCDDGTRTSAGQVKSLVLDKLGINLEYSNVFGLWLTSPQLSIQLKDRHLPCRLYKKWKELLTEYTMADYDVIQADEPILSIRRNVFFTLKDERKIKDEKVIRYLYIEAVFNVINERYPMSDEEFMELAGIQAAVNLYGRGDPEDYNGGFFRNQLGEYLPPHILPTKKSTLTKVFSKSSDSALENKVAEMFQKTYRRLVPSSGPGTQLPPIIDFMQYYLQRCRAKEFYGSVFFNGQIARKMNLVKALLPNLKDRPVVIAVNTEGVYLLDDSLPRNVMLSLPYDLLSWELTEPEEEGENYFSCLWLEWDSVEKGVQGEEMKVAKRLPIYSRQAAMMDAMIGRCVDELHQAEVKLKRQRAGEEAPTYSWTTEEGAKMPYELNPKEKKLVCTTLTEEGEVFSPGQGNYFTYTRSLRRKDPLDSFQMKEMTSPL